MRRKPTVKVVKDDQGQMEQILVKVRKNVHVYNLAEIDEIKCRSEDDLTRADATALEAYYRTLKESMSIPTDEQMERVKKVVHAVSYGDILDPKDRASSGNGG